MRKAPRLTSRLAPRITLGLALALPLAGLAPPWAPAHAQPAPQPPPPSAARQGPSPLQRFLALPPDRQEAIRNQVQPLFAQSLEANARLIRMAQDCDMPLPREAAPAEKLERDLSSRQDSSFQLLGPARQGALLARFRGALGASIDCGMAGEMRPRLVAQLAGFAPAFRETLERGLGGPAEGQPPAPPPTAEPSAEPSGGKPPPAN